MRKKFLKSLLFMIIAAGNICESFGDAPEFKDGDSICFVGDSITHAGSYHTQILLFHITRFPEMRLKVWNCGIAAENAYLVTRRYASDIASHKPGVAAIMLGMNDVKPELYLEGKSGSDVEAKRRKALENYRLYMDKLAQLLSQDGASLIFITPSIFDQTGTQKNDRRTGVAEALEICSEETRKLAEKYKAGLVDFNAQMAAVNRAGQSSNPDFTIIGPDRIHPGAPGHLLMAYLFLKAQKHSPEISTVSIDAGKNLIVTQKNCEISALTIREDSISFDCLENALPFPVDPAAEKTLHLVPFTADLNQELLKISGLRESDYEILIDGTAVITVAGKALSIGINLAEIRDTPQNIQAQAVQKLIKERASIENGKLRTFAFVERNYTENRNRTEEMNREDAEKRLSKLREEAWDTYSITMYESYLKLLPEKTLLIKKVDDLLAQAYAAAVPVKHSYLIRPSGRSSK